MASLSTTASALPVKADDLVPCQHTTRYNLKTSTDFYQQYMIKHPHLSEFHSRAEHLHAGLLEGDPAVISFVPQPFKLQVNHTPYIPDCYIVRTDQPRQVIELKAPKSSMSDSRRLPLEEFFAHQGMQFLVIENEAVLSRAVEAQNWIEIVRCLHIARSLQTNDAEYAVLENLHGQSTATLGDLVDAGDRERTYQHEIALFRLLHRGQLAADLTERPLDWDTGIWLSR